MVPRPRFAWLQRLRWWLDQIHPRLLIDGVFMIMIKKAGTYHNHSQHSHHLNLHSEVGKHKVRMGADNVGDLEVAHADHVEPLVYLRKW